MSEYTRKITSGEKSMIALNELRPPFVIQLTCEIEGEPAPEHLYAALERATEANPGCAIRLKEAEIGEPDDFWVPGPAPTLTVVDAPEFDGASAHGGDFLRWPLDAKAGPTCELVHVKTAPGRGWLVFRSLHAVMDGQDTLLWAKDVLRCLRGEDPVGHPSPLDVQALCDPMKDDKRPLPKHGALHPLGPPNLGVASLYDWRRIRVAAPLDAKISGRIAVALGEIARRRNDAPDGIIRLHLPTDLRAYAKKARTTANLFGSLFLEIDAASTPDSVGLQIFRMLYDKEGQKPVGPYAGNKTGTLAAHRVKAFWDLEHLHDDDRYAFSATLSHLGKLDSASLSGPEHRCVGAFFVPLVGDACVVSVNGFDGETELAVGVSGLFDDAGQLDDLAETLRTALA